MIHLFAHVCWLTLFFVSLLLFLLSIVENNHVLLKRKVPSIDQTYHGIYA